jgi:hypothetical protein
MSFPSQNWFRVLFGFEETVEAVKRNFLVRPFSDHVTLKSKVNGETYNAGRFTVRNILSFEVLTPVGGGRVHMVRGNGRRSSKLYLIDVLESQSYDDFDGATFLAASNFNCLEFAGPGQTAAQGVTCYIHDWTQGPFCALATGAAVVYRNYFIEHGNGAVGQIDEEIHLLKDTPLDKCVRHGYPEPTPQDLQTILNHEWDNPNQFYVGVHENCQVTTKRDSGSMDMFTRAPPGRIAHHVYAAAFNFAGSMPKCPQTLEIGKKMLMAEYRATVLAAWELSRKYPGRKGSNKLLLTVLGGGVFANPRQMICEAIISCKDVIVQSGLEVFIVCWSEGEFQESMNHLGSLVKETNGTVIDAS